ncbi:PspC domain-containing protein [Floridanema evergladense]|uniref:PspC domain-containing protein n=1 Tax=Floridaenema evergladense BLCC-F167 TaxID=3153639 RepID=A0ABV4WQV6_9CYAN
MGKIFFLSLIGALLFFEPALTAIAQKTNFPLLAVRITTVILAIIAPGFGVPLYLWLCLAFPLEPIV